MITISQCSELLLVQRKADALIPRQAVRCVSKAYAVQDKLVQLLIDLQTFMQLRDLAAKLATDLALTKVRQGCVIAPLPFNVFCGCEVRQAMPGACEVSYPTVPWRDV